MRPFSKTYLTPLLAAVSFVLFACTAQLDGPSHIPVQINPLAEGVSMDETAVRLYYGYGDLRLLAGEDRRIKVPANESVEVSLINELIREGPSSTTGSHTALISPRTTVSGVSIDGQFATVTFSREFLNPYSSTGDSPSADSERTRRFLAVFSVVNTLIEQGNCSRVRILIDEGTGAGRPLTFAEAGLPGSGDAQPFERNGDIELTPGVAMRTLLSAVERRDWDQAYALIAYRSPRGQDRPDNDAFRAQVESAHFTLSDADVIDYVSSADGNAVIVMVSYKITSSDNGQRQFVNVPKRLVLEDGVWKMTWNAFEHSFVSVE